jgi:hypothetical protein
VKWWLAVLALTGCNQAFGLDDTDLGHPCWDLGNGTSHDEDADGVADGCDTCPGTANPMQVDGDFDGVGDECDPHADSADRIAFFDAFASSQLDEMWRPFGSGAQFLLGDDALNMTAGAGAGTLILHRVFTNPSMQIVMVNHAYLDMAQFTVAGVYMRISPDDEKTFPAGWMCFSYMPPNTSSNYPSRAVVSEPQPVHDPKDDNRIMFGDPTVLAADNNGTCVARVGGNPAVTSVIQLEPIDGEVGLHVHYASASVESITVFEPAP